MEIAIYNYYFLRAQNSLNKKGRDKKDTKQPQNKRDQINKTKH